MPILYFCSNGDRVSDAQAKRRYADARYKKYSASIGWACEGCGDPATCSAHIIAQARCKVLHKTELIWNPANFFPSCYKCNAAIENPKGEAWKTLKNRDYCLEFIEKHDAELFSKFVLNF